MNGVSPCTDSQLDPGRCCVVGCNRDATEAVLFDTPDGLRECARCPQHLAEGKAIARKPFNLSPAWAET